MFNTGHLIGGSAFCVGAVCLTCSAHLTVDQLNKLENRRQNMCMGAFVIVAALINNPAIQSTVSFKV